MKTIEVELGRRSYPIHIGHDLLSDSAIFSNYLNTGQVLVVTNELIAGLYLDLVKQHLQSINHDILILPDGEHTKSLDYLDTIITRLLKNKYSRTCVLLALGGGVIGDLTGFAAACYQRGVSFIQIPTSLLAQVDASVGGKTAVNHLLGKNMIGAFYQPVAVIADTSVLQSLPNRELSAGLAEVIKYGLICDAEFFQWLQANIERLVNQDEQALAYAVERSCINKAAIVATDECESGPRAILNLGHTFGHAIETALSYQDWLHGEAVGCGMLIAADLSRRLGHLERQDVSKIEEILIKASLPVRVHKSVTPEQMLENMKVDKKSKDGVLQLILLKAIGKATITSDFSMATLTETINHFMQ